MVLLEFGAITHTSTAYISTRIGFEGFQRLLDSELAGWLFYEKGPHTTLGRD
jgi:hypothetical protein